MFTSVIENDGGTTVCRAVGRLHLIEVASGSTRARASDKTRFNLNTPFQDRQEVES